MSSVRPHPEDAVEHVPDGRSPAGFGNRAQLLVDLEKAVAEASKSRLMVIFELDGLRRHSRAFGSSAARGLVTRLSKRLAHEIGTSGSCYGLREAEICALIDDPVSERSRFLDALATTLGRAGDGCEIAFGAVLVPDETVDGAGALVLADQRLNVQKRAHGGDPQGSYEPVLT